MNTTILFSNTHPLPGQSIVMLDEEKNRLMEKVYNSNVFQEFIRQWGSAMAIDEYEKEKKTMLIDRY